MTLRQYISLSYFLGYRQRWTLVLSGLSFAAAVMEAAGLVLLLPIFEFIQAKGDIATLAGNSKIWAHLASVFSFTGLRLTLPLLMATSFVLILLRQVFTFLKSVATQMVAEAIMRRIRVKGARAYLCASAAHHDQVKVGEIVNALTTEASGTGAALTAPSRILGIAVIAMVYVSTLSMLSVPLTVMALLLGAVLAITLRRVMTATQNAGRSRLAASDQWFKLLIRRLQNARLIRISGTEDFEAASINRQATALEKHSVAITRLRTLGDVLVEPIVAAFGLALLYFATQDYGMTIGEVGLFLVILLRLSPVAKAAASEAQLLAANLPSLEVVGGRIRDMENAAELETGREIFTRLDREIRLEDVWFRYPSRDEFALKGINLTIKQGQVVAIVGPSGAGKSTLIDLLFRIRDPQAGRVMLDDQPMPHFTRRSIRDHIAYIPQNTQTLAETVAGHVAYGRDGLVSVDIERGLQLAGAAEFVSQLPQGAETVLQDIGSGLSGGQLQRIELARALARHAQLLVMDEPTSNLDVRSEAAVRSSIAALRRLGEHTIVIVAHRLSLISDADLIVVVEDGQVRERGRHDALMASGGWYAQAWKHQETGTASDPAVNRMVAGQVND